MKNFPVTNSTLSATHLGFFLEEKYKLSPNTTCDLLKTGINDSYLLTDNADRYVFRIYSLNWRTEQEINEEIRLLNILQQNNIPVSYPLPDDKGVYIQQLDAPEGDRYGVLFTYAKGEKLLNFSEVLHYKTGQIMARMHQVTLALKLERTTYTPEVVLIDSFNHLKQFLPSGTPEMDFMVSAQQYLLAEFEKIKTDEVRLGAIHLDIWFDNLSIFNETDITLFDFDFCGNGMLCYDIAYYILQLNSTEKDERECNLKTDAFLAGYESICPISTEEKRLIPMLGVSLYFFYLGVQCYRFNNWSNTFLNQTYLKRFINLLVKSYFEKNGLG